MTPAPDYSINDNNLYFISSSDQGVKLLLIRYRKGRKSKLRGISLRISSKINIMRQKIAF